MPTIKQANNKSKTNILKIGIILICTLIVFSSFTIISNISAQENIGPEVEWEKTFGGEW